jgi:hypothetical protein
MTQMSYQIFTTEKKPIGDPVEIFAPNEISLAQLVRYIILPTGIQLDASSVFYWNPREIEDPTKTDKTKKILEEVPGIIPRGFNLRVKCSSLRDHSTKKMAHVRFGTSLMNFAMAEDAKLGRLKERVADWMTQRGQRPDWAVEGSDREDIDYGFEYEVVQIEREVPVRIFMKQAEISILPSESWINLSDRLVKKWKLPVGTLLRIFPVEGTVDNQDDEDHSYTINWETDKQGQR